MHHRYFSTKSYLDRVLAIFTVRQLSQTNPMLIDSFHLIFYLLALVHIHKFNTDVDVLIQQYIGRETSLKRY